VQAQQLGSAIAGGGAGGGGGHGGGGGGGVGAGLGGYEQAAAVAALLAWQQQAQEVNDRVQLMRRPEPSNAAKP